MLPLVGSSGVWTQAVGPQVGAQAQSRAAFALSPLMIGMIVVSFVARPLLAKAGSAVVTGGLLVTVVGAAALWLATGHQGGAGVEMFAPAVFLLGVGMGPCVASMCDVAAVDVQPDEAGGRAAPSAQSSSSPPPSAPPASAPSTSTTSPRVAAAAVPPVAVAAAIAFGCLGLVRLIPRTASADVDTSPDPAGAVLA